jgi:4-hydroxy-2-oxoglutarate aldolase
MKLQGIFAEITTPFDHKGDIYKTKVEHNVEKWNHTTLAGYVVCGRAGEGELLAAEEKAAVWEMVAKWASPEKMLIAAVAMPGVRESVTLANRAADLGYKAALLDVPYRRAEIQLAYFRAIADQSRIPVIAGAVDTGVAAISQHPNIVAVCGDAGKVAGAGLSVSLDVLVRSAAHLWSGLQSGATGAILDFAAAAPYACIAIWEAHRTREEEAGVDWQNRVLRAAELIGEYQRGVPGLKHAMDLNAYYGGPPRLPLVVPGAEARREIEEAFGGFKG